VRADRLLLQMSGARLVGAIVAGGLALLASAPARSGTSKHFVPAFHVEFQDVPDDLLSAVSTYLGTSNPQKICKMASERLEQSSNPALRDLAVMLAGRSATFEPSFGCRALGRGGTKDRRARFWTLRVRLPLLLRWRFLEKTQARLAKIPGVKTVAPVPRGIPAQPDPTQQVTPTPLDLDPYVGDPEYDEPSRAPYGTQWYLHACHVLETWGSAWPPTDPATAPVIAVVDFGFRTGHPELQPVLKMDRAWNTCDETTNVDWGSEVKHGTGTAGLLGAAKDGNGMMGVAYGAEVWPIQGTCEEPTSDTDSTGGQSSGDPWAKAVDWVTEADSGGRRKIVVLTVQTSDKRSYESNLALREAIARAAEENVVVVLAAGNGGYDVAWDIKGDFIPETEAILGATVHEPAATRWGDSNYGTRVVVSAPGDPAMDVTLSSDAALYCRQFGATSGATPKVAGVVAMMLTVNPALTPAQVKEILGHVGDPVASDADKPAGHFLNADLAVQEALAQAPH
jgi:subtilisin family serine protease